jgi:hypothetical protein
VGFRACSHALLLLSVPLGTFFGLAARSSTLSLSRGSVHSAPRPPCRVATVNVQPDVCMQYFKDPKKVFAQLFPRIDRMFTHGKVLGVPTKERAVCHATFQMPMPVGNAPARGIRSRDFVWCAPRVHGANRHRATQRGNGP